MKSFNDAIIASEDWVNGCYKPFTAIDLKAHLVSLGFEVRPRAYGSIFQNLHSNGLIKENGFKRGVYGKKQGGMMKVWISNTYCLKQQKNATKDNGTLPIEFE